MKKSIILFIIIALSISISDSFGQRVKKDKKPKTGKTTTEQTTSLPKQPATTVSVGGNSKVETSSQTKEPKPVEIVNFDALVAASKPVITQQPFGSINWSEQYIEAKGSAVIDYERFPNAAQARAMATRGAIVVAQRNLLEIIQGVNVVSETKVKDMMTQSDYIYTRVDGLVKGAQQYGEAIEKDGMMEVTMRIPLYETNGLAPVVYEGIPGVGKKSFASGISEGDIEIPSGLVFNFNGKTYDPAMFPMVVDKNGKILLDMTHLYDPKEGKFPKILSGTKDIFNELNFKEGTQVIDVIQSFDGKIVVDPEKTPKINWDKIQKGVSTATKIVKFVLTLI